MVKSQAAVSIFFYNMEVHVLGLSSHELGQVITDYSIHWLEFWI